MNTIKPKIGVFYQAGVKLPACYYALERFRRVYPFAPVAFYEDNGDTLSPVAKKFKCVYRKVDKAGINSAQNGRPVYNLETCISWLKRLHEACTTILTEVDYVIHFEDDVWVTREIETNPPYDLTGLSGAYWNKDLYQYLNVAPAPISGCGGAIFDRKKFIQAYENFINTVDWNKIKEYDARPLEWTDSALTLVFLFSHMTVGPWHGTLKQYTAPIPNTPLWDRNGWPGLVEDLEKTQGNAAIIHCFKPYYFPTSEETKNAEESIRLYKPYKNPFDKFSSIYYINLEERTDRKEETLQEFAKYNINAIRIPGVSLTDEENENITKNGGIIWNDAHLDKFLKRQRGCTIAHLNAIKQAKETGLKNVLLFEDDILFANDIDVLSVLNNALEDLEKIDWDMFVLGSNPRSPIKKITNNLGLLDYFYCTHAIVYNSTCYDTFLEFSFSKMMVVDQHTSRLSTAGRVKAYTPLTPIAFQRKSVSSITGSQYITPDGTTVGFMKDAYKTYITN